MWVALLQVPLLLHRLLPVCQWLLVGLLLGLVLLLVLLPLPPPSMLLLLPP
jgi:hypothetical protein